MAELSPQEILKLVEKHFEEWEADEDGYRWIEFAGKPDAYVKFAQKIYEIGYNNGYSECSFDMGDENV